MSEVRYINGVNLLAAGNQSGTPLSNVVKRTAQDVYFVEYTIDTTRGDGTLNYNQQVRGNTGYFIAFGDGTIVTFTGGDTTYSHTYSSPGTYTIRATGLVGPRITNSQGSAKITDMIRWDSWNLRDGFIGWFQSSGLTTCTSLRGVQKNNPVVEMDSVFRSCSTLVGGVVDALVFDFSQPVEFQSTFLGATLFNEDIGVWNVKPDNCNNTFNNTTAFNRDLSNWDFSICPDFGGMFSGATAFNQSVGSWDMSSATGLSGMFRNCSTFNDGNTPGAAGGGVGIGIDTWDTSNVTSMREMFRDCNGFNSYIGSWQLPKLTGASASLHIFAFSSTNFNPDLSNWDFQRTKSTGANTSVVTNKLVDSTADFVSDNVQVGHFVRNLTDKTLSKATVTAVSTNELTLDTDIFLNPSERYIVWFGTISATFFVGGGTPFNSGLAPGVSGTRMSGWDTQGFFSLQQAFANSAFNQDISTWKVNELTTINNAFGNGFNQDLSGWERSTVGDESSTCRITNMSNAFSNARNFNAGLGPSVGGSRMNNWDVSGCTDFGGCFALGVFNQDISSWSLQGSLSGMFQQATFNCGSPSGTSTNTMRSTDVSSVSSFQNMFNQNFWFNQEIGAPVAPDTSSGWDVSGADNLVNMLFFATNFNQDLNPWIFQTGANISQMCFQSGMSDANIAASLVGWDNPSQGTGVNASGWCASQPGTTPRTLAIATYPAAKTAYDNLIAPVGSGGKGWDMTGAITWV